MTTQQDQTHKNEVHSSTHIKVEVKKEPHCHVTLEIEGDASIVKEAKKKALKEIAKEVSIPGFRKGKAPASILEKKFPEALKEGMEKAFADNAFFEGNKLARVPVLNGKSKITFKMIHLDETGGKASFSFETEPEIPVIDFSKFILPDIKEETIDDEKAQETIDSLRMFYATWNPVSNRPVQEGDFVVLDIDDLDQTPAVQAFSNARFEVKDKKMAHWMQKLIVGRNQGESVEGTSEPNHDEPDEVKKEFKKKKVKIHIKTIEEPLLPELNDEFAARLGVKTASELKKRIKDLLIKQEHDRIVSEKRSSISDQINQLYHFDIPSTILEQEANHRMNSFLKQPGMTKKWNDEFTPEQKETKKNEIKADSEKAIRLFYVCRKIIQEQKISVSEEELSPSYDTMLDMMFADPARVNFRNQSKHQQAVEYSKFMMAKAQDHIIQQLQNG